MTTLRRDTTELDPPPRRGAAVAAAWLLLVTGLAIAFAHTFREMWIRWFPAWSPETERLYDKIIGGESYYTHGPLIPLVSLFIGFLLVRHTRIPVRPRPLPGFVLLGVSLLVHLGSRLADVNFASGFSLIGVLGGLILVLWGWTALRRLWFPLALLAFMVPLPEVTIYNWNFRLKMLASQLGVFLANGLGVVAERSGNEVFLPDDKRLVIANICNGLRTIISLLAFGALYAYVCRLRGAWRWALFAASVPTAVVSNAIRVVGLIVVADLWTVRIATGLFHDVSGLFIYVIALGIMFGLERLFLWIRGRMGRSTEAAPLFEGVRRGPEDEGQWGRMVAAAGCRSGWMASIVVVLAGGLGLWFGQMVSQRRDLPIKLPETVTIDGREWPGHFEPLDPDTERKLNYPAYDRRVYVSPRGDRITCTIIMGAVHPPDVCDEGGGWDIVRKTDLTIPNVSSRAGLPCRELISQKGETKKLCLYTYKCGSSYTQNFWVQRLMAFGDHLLARPTTAALIRADMMLPRSETESRSRAVQLYQSVIPHIDRQVVDLGKRR